MGAIAFAAWFLLLPSSEPSYNGRTLSEWLFALSSYRDDDSISDADATEAFQTMGSNCVPYLLEWSSAPPRPSFSRELFLKVMLKPRWNFLARACPRNVWQWAGKNIEAGRFEALPRAFDAFGPLAISAMPRLRKLRDTHSDPNIRWMAALNLAILSTNEIPKVVAVLGDTASPHWSDTYVAFRDLPSLRTNAFSAIPHFVDALGYRGMDMHNDPSMFAYIALESLAEVPRLRPIILTSLTNLLDSPQPQLRADAASLIAEITKRIPGPE